MVPALLRVLQQRDSTRCKAVRVSSSVANGVQIALLVDPHNESVLAFTLDGATRVWHRSDFIDLSDMMHDFKPRSRSYSQFCASDSGRVPLKELTRNFRR